MPPSWCRILIEPAVPLEILSALVSHGVCLASVDSQNTDGAGLAGPAWRVPAGVDDEDEEAILLASDCESTSSGAIDDSPSCSLRVFGSSEVLPGRASL